MALILKDAVRIAEINDGEENALTGVIVDYNSWVESDQGRRLAASLDKDTVLAEGT